MKFAPRTFNTLWIIVVLLASCTSAPTATPSPLPPTATAARSTATMHPPPTVAATQIASETPLPPISSPSPTAPAWIEPTQPATATPLPTVLPDASTESLRKYASERGVYIGAAVNNGQVNQPDYAAVLGREYNLIVLENALKFGPVHPEPGRYDFSASDEIVNFAIANGMKVRGHVLVWQQQMPDWLKYGSYTREQLSEILHNHITTVVSHYKGRIYAWDVVNEAMGSSSLNSTFWYRNLGPDYVDLAFQWAHEADPGALLFYNDYGSEGITPKADSIYKMVKSMKERGIPIDGVGLQGHFELGKMPPIEDIAANIQRLGELGLQVHITELDIRVKIPADSATLQRQAQDYAGLLKTCLSEKACTAFVMWGMTDKYSWIPSANKGYGAALIFDEQYQPKPAYTALLEVLKQK